MLSHSVIATVIHVFIHFTFHHLFISRPVWSTNARTSSTRFLKADRGQRLWLVKKKPADTSSRSSRMVLTHWEDFCPRKSLKIKILNLNKFETIMSSCLQFNQIIRLEFPLLSLVWTTDYDAPKVFRRKTEVRNGNTKYILNVKHK